MGHPIAGGTSPGSQWAHSGSHTHLDPDTLQWAPGPSASWLHGPDAPGSGSAPTDAAQPMGDGPQATSHYPDPTDTGLDLDVVTDRAALDRLTGGPDRSARGPIPDAAGNVPGSVDDSLAGSADALTHAHASGASAFGADPVYDLGPHTSWASGPTYDIPAGGA